MRPQMDYSTTSTETDTWFGLQTPGFMIAILAVYLLYVLKIGPDFMKNRGAFQLKNFIKVYNISQVVACVYVIIEILNITSLNVLAFWKCSLFEQNTWHEYRFNRLTYFIFWLKTVELSETVVFVLRKKQNQVSKLHVFHHCSTLSLVYILFKYYRGGSALYPLLLNSIVHIVMYSYYFLAAVADKKTVSRLMPVKKSITTIQMVQFVMILLQAVVNSQLCEVSPIIVGYYGLIVSLMFYGFYDFYKSSYQATNAAKAQVK